MRYAGLLVSAALLCVVAVAPSSALAEGAKEVTPDTLAAALAEAGPGDELVLADGVYEGGFEITRSGSEGAPIAIRAAGENCVFEGGRDGLLIDNASWITVEGIRFQHARRAGVFVKAPADDRASHITFRNCVFADNRSWGLITGHIDHLLIENNEAYGSLLQHGIYVANSGDHPVIRGNRIHHNGQCGLHMNGDPECGGDGVISNALVENNVIWENGKRGGGAINCTHIQDSLYRNNLVFNNYASGIITYYDTGGTPCASKRNRIMNNTVYFRPGEGRWALSLQKESTDATVKNNILIGGVFAAIQVQPSSIEGLLMDNNVIYNHPGQQFSGYSSEDVSVSVEEWRKQGFDLNSVIGEMPRFVDPEAGDFHLLGGSIGIDGGVELAEEVPVDIEGTARPQGKGFDIGCYER